MNTIIVRAESIIYAVYIDPGYGFYKVRDITTHNSNFLYDNRTLDINQGDSVEWINDADNTALTVISSQNLFTPVNLKIGKSFLFQFAQSGVFDFYINEYPDKRQTIIVNPIGGTVITAIETSIPNPVETTPIPVEITETPAENPTVEIPTEIPTEIATPINNSADNISNSDTINNTNNVAIENIKLSNTAIPSIIISIISILIMFRSGKKG